MFQQSKNKILVCFYLLFFGILPQISHAYTPYAKNLEKYGVYYRASLNYFKTQKVVDSKGNAIELTDPLVHQRTDIDALIGYGVTSKIELYSGLKYRHITTQFLYPDGTTKKELNLKTSGIESYLVGLKYALPKISSLNSSLEAWYRHATYENKYYDTSVDFQKRELAIGEGSREYALGINLLWSKVPSHLFEARFFYRSIGEGLADELFMSGQYAYDLEKFYFSTGLDFTQAIGSASNSTSKSNSPSIFQGISQQFDSSERSIIEPFIAGGYHLNQNWSINLKGSMVLSGTSTDLGPKLLFNLERRSSAKPQKQKYIKTARPKSKNYVVKVARSHKLVVINKGMKNGIRKKHLIYFYTTNSKRKRKIIAIGKVIKILRTKAIVKITKKRARQKIQVGTMFLIKKSNAKLP